MHCEISEYLRIDTVSKVYGSVNALDSIELSVRQGEFVTLLGASGSGKTTTLGCIAGFVAPSAGSIRLDGKDITTVPAHRRDIGVVFQNYALFPHMSVADNVAYPLRARRVQRADTARKVNAALDLVRLSAMGERRPDELSGGQQQRVAIARAIVFEPRLLLLDEPMGALDKNLREQLQLEVMRLHRELNITIVSVTHDQEEALTMSDRIAVYRAGRIEQVGSAQDLYNRPSSRYVAEFIGESNAFVGIAKRRAGAYSIEIPGVGSLATPHFDKDLDGQPVVLIVRPEMMTVTLADASVNGVNQMNTLVARVVDTVYVGSSLKYIVRTTDGNERQVRVPVDGRREVPRNESVLVSWPCSVGRVLATGDSDE